jgi:hypothetical protein
LDEVNVEDAAIDLLEPITERKKLLDFDLDSVASNASSDMSISGKVNATMAT